MRLSSPILIVTAFAAVVLAEDTTVVSPLVSYQYLAAPDSAFVASPQVSYQYLEGPNGYFGTSPIVSYLVSDVPILTNLQATAIPASRSVSILYDLASPGNAAVRIDVAVSANGGTTYSIVPVNMSGAVGAGVLPGSGRQITWYAGLDWANQQSSQMRVRVTATLPGGSAAAESPVFSLDTRQLDLIVSEIEVAQVLQDPSLPLIAGRPTLARVAVDWDGSQAQVAGVDARLYLQAPGDPVRLLSSTGAITAHKVVEWEQERSTINFIFNAPLSGTADIWAEVNPPGQSRIAERDYANNVSATTHLSFECRKPLTIKYVPIDYRFTATGPDPNLPDLNTIREGTAEQLVRATWPAQSLDYSTLQTRRWFDDLNSEDGRVKFLEWLERLRLLQQPPPDYLFAWLNRTGGNPGNPDVPGQSLHIPGRVAYGTTGGAREEFLFTHEMGHCFGLCHPAILPDPLCLSFGSKKEVADPLLTTIGINPTKFRWKPLVIDPAPPNCPSDPDPTGDLANCVWSVMNPAQMPHFVWLDLASYRHFLAFETLRCPAQMRSRDSAGSGSLLVSGLSDPVAMAVTISDIEELSYGEPTASDPEGNLVLQALHNGASGDELVYSLQFSAISTECVSCKAAFVVVVPKITDPQQTIDRFVVISAPSGSVMGQRLRTQGSPEPVLIQPTPNQEITNGMLVSWSGTDPDGDQLHYSLSYSWDSGQSWLPLETDTTDTQMVLSTGILPGSLSGEARLRLTVTDGVNTGSTETAGLTLAGRKPPVAHIVSPAAGLSVEEGVPLLLSAGVSDLEDVSVPDTQVQWSSDLDGSLGSGHILVTTGLSLGLHQITVTAVDSDGLTGEDSRPLTVIPRAVLVATVDFDFDNDVDLEDLAVFNACATGPAIPYTPGACSLVPDGQGHIVVDFDKDGDVDQTDFGVFQRCLSGQGNPANPACAE
jgi:hypothetical protein